MPDGSAASWNNVFAYLAQATGWQALIKRAFARHLVQETIAHDTVFMHEQILHELQEQGRAVPHSAATTHPAQLQHSCEHCGALFQDKRALANHRFKVHGLHSEERGYIQSTRCGGCLREFHTSHRMLQHLKYYPNGCFRKLRAFRTPASPVNVVLEGDLKNIPRIPCERLAHGPLLPNHSECRRSRIKTEQLMASGTTPTSPMVACPG
eukprot:Skav236706  [mRNA]  locus=scaffold738:267559:268185:+ [translate_table: standard]